VGNKQVKKKLAAIMVPLIPSQTTAITVTASQPGIVVTKVGAIEPGQVQPPPMLDLLKRIASQEREMEVVRARNNMSMNKDCVTVGEVGVVSTPSGPPDKSAIVHEWKRDPIERGRQEQCDIRGAAIVERPSTVSK